MRSAKRLSVEEGLVHGRAASTRRRVPVLLALAAAALGLHGLALSGLRWTWPQADAAPVARTAVQMRAVPGTPVVAPPARPADAELHVEPSAAPLRTARVRPPAAPRPAPDAAPLATATAAEPAPTAVSPVASAQDDDAVPTYPTRIPPAATLRYRLQRGAAQGNGELTWQPGGNRYALRFASQVDGAAALQQVSEGEFDAAGVAPLRFVDQRFRRAAAAANFQRDAGRITFSGKAAAAPLRPGSQDRLSWMLQLAAIVAADPALRQGGARVSMPVANATGDVAVWAFRCVATGVVEAGSGVADTLAFVREPRGPYDTRAEVWLDPARSYLPVRAVWKSGAADDGFDLQLEP